MIAIILSEIILVNIELNKIINMNKIKNKYQLVEDYTSKILYNFVNKELLKQKLNPRYFGQG